MNFDFEDLQQIVVEEFSEKHVESLASMWKVSDADWPGSFSAGMEITPQKLLEEMKKIKTACRFVLWHRLKNQVVGIMEFLEIPGNREAVYAGLNIHPEYRGAAILLVANIWTRSIDKLVELQYRYVEMETWPTNAKVITISKQAGFFWVPDTAVRMENYFPLLMQTPLIIKFFTKHDIVECQYEIALQKIPEMKEDKIIWNNIQVFPYEWRKGKEYIKALIDVKGRGITGIENQDFSLYCYPADGNIAFAGMKKEIIWEIVNKKETPLRVSLYMSCEEGLGFERIYPYKAIPEMEMFEKMKWGYEIRRPYTYEVKDRIIIKENVKISPDAPSFSRIRAAPRINTKIFVEGDQADLQTGLDIREIVDFRIIVSDYLFKKNEEKEIFLTVFNNYLEKIKSRIVIYSEEEGVEINFNSEFFELEVEERLDIPVKIKFLKSGSFILKFYIFSEISGEIYKSREKSEAVFVLEEHSFSGAITPEKLVMENFNLRIEFEKKSGILEIKDKFKNSSYLKQSPEEIGPPFYIISGDILGEEQEFEIYLEKEKDFIRGIIEKKIKEFEGLILQKEIIISQSSLIKINYKFFNRSSSPHNFSLKIKTEVKKSDVNIVVPLKEGIIREPLIGREFPALSGDLPEKEEDYRETWSAFEDFPYVCGVIWKDAEKIEFGIQKAPHLIYDIHISEMGKINLPPLYLYAGGGDYQIIRNYYSFLVKETEKVNLKKIVDVETQPEIIFLQREETKFKLNFKNLRGKYLRGELQIKLPEELEMEKNNFGVENSLSCEVILKRKKFKRGIYKGETCFKGEVSDLKFEIPVVVISGEDNCEIELKEKKENGKRILEVDNKFLKFSISEDFYGTIFSLKKENFEYLISSYPSPVEFSWFTPWCGGISPVCLKDLSFPVKIPLQNYKICFTEKFDKWENKYKGIKLSCLLSSFEFKGVYQEIEYLTLPGSNILFIISRLSNNTDSCILGFAGFGIFLTPSDGSVIYFKRGERIISRKRSIYDAWSGSERWSSVKLKENEYLVLVSDPASKIIAADLGLMGHHLFAGSQIKLKKGESLVNLYFLVITETLSSAISYEELSKIVSLF